MLSMTKIKLVYCCGQCGGQFPKWSGQCGQCGKWNTLVEETHAKSPGQMGYTTDAAFDFDNAIASLADVECQQEKRIATGLKELDHVLGGGLVLGSVVLLGGDPGIGKSTLLLQTLSYLCRQYKVLYISGEESLQQIGLRAERLGLNAGDLRVFTQTQVEIIISMLTKEAPDVVVIDSASDPEAVISGFIGM